MKQTVFEQLELDWSLKTMLTLTSTKSLDWLKKGDLSCQVEECLVTWTAFGLELPKSHVNIVARVLAKEKLKNKANTTPNELIEMVFFKTQEEEWYVYI